MFKMLLPVALLALVPAFVCGQADGQYPFDVTSISSPDGSMTAKFVSIGATLTELWVKDKNGKARDIVLGYDDNTKLLTDPAHPVFNAIVGRYWSRIRNGTFSIPITKEPQPDGPNVYHTSKNDNGKNTFHGGFIGWDRRNWTIAEYNETSVTYKHVDNADEGFPGTVTAFTTHSLQNGGIYNVIVEARATQKTPIMLTQHVYWNLDAFQDGSTNILAHNLQLDGSRILQVDGNWIPTGQYIDVSGKALDFRTQKRIDWDWNQTVGLCGDGCQGYDNCYIYDGDHTQKPAATLSSNNSGIKLEIFTNQPATELFTASGMGGANIPRKAVHGGPNVNYPDSGAVALEQVGYMDAINTPEFNQDQIYGPDRDFEWSSTYKFSYL